MLEPVLDVLRSVSFWKDEAYALYTVKPVRLLLPLSDREYLLPTGSSLQEVKTL